MALEDTEKYAAIQRGIYFEVGSVGGAKSRPVLHVLLRACVS